MIPNIDEMIGRPRRAGLLAAVVTFWRKTTLVVADFAAGLILEYGSFVKGSQVRSPKAVTGIDLVLFIGTVGHDFMAGLSVQSK